METKQAINLVATRCKPEDQAKFDRWMDETHIPMLLKFSGMTKVTRYKILKEFDDSPTRLVIYEFKDQKALEAYENSPELATAKEETAETWKESKFEIVWRIQFEELNTWVK